MEATNKEYISIREAAKMLSVSLITLHQWSKKGRLKNYQFGKSVFYRRSDLEALKNNAIIRTTEIKEEILSETQFNLFNIDLLKGIYKVLIKSRGANVRIVARKFQGDSQLSIEPYIINEPIVFPRFIPFDMNEVLLNGNVKTIMRGELSYTEIMNLFE